jgi:hypothetical protein
MRALLITSVMLFAACTGEISAPNGTISLRGRVVDGETCASTAGCTAVPQMIVALRSDPERIRSAPTGADGTFVLEDVPVGYRHDLIVRAEDGAASFAPTLNPRVVAPSDDEDRFGVELYVLPRDPGSLLDGLRAEGIDLVLGGGYVGQAVRVEGSMVTAAAGARIDFHPPPRSLRFVNVIPRFVVDQPVLLPAEAVATGPFGLFVAEAAGPTDPVAVIPLEDGFLYELVVAPLEPGFVTYAIHRGVADL